MQRLNGTLSWRSCFICAGWPWLALNGVRYSVTSFFILLQFKTTTIMKTLITSLGILCLFLNVNAQDIDKNRKDYSPYGIDYPILNANMTQLARHGEATQITYFDLNFVDSKMQSFMKEMGMAIVHFPQFGKENGFQTLTVKYKQQATMGTNNIPYLVFKYVFFTNKQNHPIIKSCAIYGSSNYVVNFYASYWPTAINFDAHKGTIAYNYLLQDKATIRLNQSGNWSISIENTTIHDLTEYYRELDKNSNYNNNQENAFLKQQKSRKDSLLNITNKDSIYRDSLINIARNYQIPYSQKIDNLTPTSGWLEVQIKQSEDRLNNGRNYNPYKFDTLFKEVNKKIKLNKENPLTGNLLFKIDADGVITQMKSYDISDKVTPDILNTLNNFFIGKKITPFVLNGKPYPSFKKYAFLFMKPFDEIRFGDQGYSNNDLTANN